MYLLCYSCQLNYMFPPEFQPTNTEQNCIHFFERNTYRYTYCEFASFGLGSLGRSAEVTGIPSPTSAYNTELDSRGRGGCCCCCWMVNPLSMGWCPKLLLNIQSACVTSSPTERPRLFFFKIQLDQTAQTCDKNVFFTWAFRADKTALFGANRFWKKKE